MFWAEFCTSNFQIISLPPPPSPPHPPLPFEDIAAQHAALPPVQPVFDLQAAMDAAREQDERWMQQMCNHWWNEQQGQQQLQQDEEEEERQMLFEHRDLMR